MPSKTLHSLELKIGAWFLSCALAGVVLGTFVNPNPIMRSQRTTSMRYARGSQRIVRLNLKRRGGS